MPRPVTPTRLGELREAERAARAAYDLDDGPEPRRVWMLALRARNEAERVYAERCSRPAPRGWGGA